MVQYLLNQWIALAALVFAFLAFQRSREATDNTRRLRQAKKKLRRMARKATELRDAEGTLPGQAEAWRNGTADAVGHLLGDEARG